MEANNALINAQRALSDCNIIMHNDQYPNQQVIEAEKRMYEHGSASYLANAIKDCTDALDSVAKAKESMVSIKRVLGNSIELDGYEMQKYRDTLDLGVINDRIEDIEAVVGREE